MTRELLAKALSGGRKVTGEEEAKLLKRATHLHLNSLGLTEACSLIDCPKLEVLYLYDNSISKLSSLDTATNLTHLYLQNNKLTNLEGLTFLPKLQKLYLESNSLSWVSGLKGCSRLEELHLSDQRFADGSQQLSFDPATLDNLSGSLRVLSIAGCQLTDDNVAIISFLRKLQRLDLSRNRLATVEAVDTFLPALADLRKCDLRDNRVARVPKYREQLILMSDSLQELDGVEVTAQQRAFLLRLQIHRIKTQMGGGAASRSEPPSGSSRALSSSQKCHGGDQAGSGGAQEGMFGLQGSAVT